MIYIINYDMQPTELKVLLKDYKDSIRINCLSYSLKSLGVIIENSLLSTGLDKLNNSMVYIIENTYFANNNIFKVIFKYWRKNIYIINISKEQEKYLYKNYKGKYRYYNCSYRKDDTNLKILKLMFLKDNRYKLLDIDYKYKLHYILKVLSYNLVDTDLKKEDLLKNYELMLNLDKYCYRIDNSIILSLLANNYEIPNYIPKLNYPPSTVKKKKNKKEKDKKLTNKDMEKLAKEKMVEYFKLKNEKFFSNIKTETKKQNNIKGLI